jgi:hypothetical protein
MPKKKKNTLNRTPDKKNPRQLINPGTIGKDSEEYTKPYVCEKEKKSSRLWGIEP